MPFMARLVASGHYFVKFRAFHHDFGEVQHDFRFTLDLPQGEFTRSIAVGPLTVQVSVSGTKLTISVLVESIPLWSQSFDMGALAAGTHIPVVASGHGIRVDGQIEYQA